jgi:Aldehyde dehydrogenase family
VNAVRSQPQPLARRWIGGGWAGSGYRCGSIDPATSTVIGQYVKAVTEEGERAIAVAERVFGHSAWRFDRDQRARALNSMAEAFEARREERAEILALETARSDRKPASSLHGRTRHPLQRGARAHCTGRAAHAGQGRMRGLAVIDDFLQYKHIAFALVSPQHHARPAAAATRRGSLTVLPRLAATLCSATSNAEGWS